MNRYEERVEMDEVAADESNFRLVDSHFDDHLELEVFHVDGAGIGPMVLANSLARLGGARMAFYAH